MELTLTSLFVPKMNDQSRIENFLWPNKLLLNALGIWPLEPNSNVVLRYSTYFRIVFSMFVILSLFIPQMLMIGIHWGDIFILTGEGCIAIAVFQLIFKLLYVLVYNKEFHSIYQEAKELWVCTDVKREREDLEKFALLAKRITISLFLFGLIFNGISMITPSLIIWMNKRLVRNATFRTSDLPLNIWYGIDVLYTPKFEILMMYQIFAIFVCGTGVMGFDTTMLTLILHICGQFRLVRTRFQTIGDRIRNKYGDGFDAESIDREFRFEIGQCIEHHTRAIRIAQEMNELLSPMVLAQLTMAGVEICLSGFALTSRGAQVLGPEGLKFGAYLGTMLAELVAWCWPGQVLADESAAIAEVVCQGIPLYQLPRCRQRDLAFIATRARRRCCLTALGSQIMCIAELTKVFNTAASFFALLRNFIEKQD